MADPVRKALLISAVAIVIFNIIDVLTTRALLHRWRAELNPSRTSPTPRTSAGPGYHLKGAPSSSGALGPRLLIVDGALVPS